MASLSSRILSFLMGMTAGESRGGTLGGAASRIMGGLSPDTATDYPSEPTFYYDMVYKAGEPYNNASLNRGEAQLAGRMQTLEEHNRALNKYVTPGMDPIQKRWAIEKGKEEEARLPSFWKDSKPRRSITPGSSAVSGVRINNDNTISVQFGGKGKWYTYSGGPTRFEASLAAKDLITAPSIGRAINSKSGFWGTTHKLF